MLNPHKRMPNFIIKIKAEKEKYGKKIYQWILRRGKD
jgi:hypothetical protein